MRKLRDDIVSLDNKCSVNEILNSKMLNEVCKTVSQINISVIVRFKLL